MVALTARPARALPTAAPTRTGTTAALTAPSSSGDGTGGVAACEACREEPVADGPFGERFRDEAGTVLDLGRLPRQGDLRPRAEEPFRGVLEGRDHVVQAAGSLTLLEILDHPGDDPVQNRHVRTVRTPSGAAPRQ